MPSKTPKQAKLMSAVAHGWKPKGGKVPVSVEVAKEFHNEDMKKVGLGGKVNMFEESHPGHFKKK